MVTSLDEAKRHVRDQLLGREGVHAVGVRRDQNAVAVYVDSDAKERVQGLVSQLKPAIEPYDIIVIPDARAAIT
jgi:hypothetical protein